MPTTDFVFSRETTFTLPATASSAVGYAWRFFQRDFEKVFGNPPRITTTDHAHVCIGQVDNTIAAPAESFRIHFGGDEKEKVLHLDGADELGLVYALLHLSETVLGVDPFWFWCDREPQPQTEIRIPCVAYASAPMRIRFRGWFVNDEVCLIGWSDSYPPPASTWLAVFETLLRCGGNLVIPGTDLPRHGVHWDLAADMGLYVTHHHAEPLGAEMFCRAHPDSDASYARNPEAFEALWQEAIDRQKDRKVVWTLGFRGQGDCPFWEQDPSFDTPAKRGELISRAIRRQYDLLHAAVDHPPCLSYLYGELTDLYQQGHLVFPPGVTKIWADNGYGKMVSRRQWNLNPRLDSLPSPTETGPHGLYYHATFHDLQASSHLVMLPVDSTLLVSELQRAAAHAVDRVWLINCGNIRPHVYTLDLIRRLWRGETVDAADFPTTFSRRYFPSRIEEAARCLRSYFAAAIRYGAHADDMAGDEFYHHPARSLIGHLMRGETAVPAEDLVWATGEVAFDAQVDWFHSRCTAAIPELARLEQDCLALAQTLSTNEAVFFRDFLLFQAQLHHSGCRGLALLCRAMAAHRAGRQPESFVLASQSLWAYQASLQAMEEAEHGKWQGFFSADWLTNIRITLYTLDALRKYLRMFGDNPDYFLWSKTYLLPASERKIMLENTQRQTLSDDELAQALQALDWEYCTPSCASDLRCNH